MFEPRYSTITMHHGDQPVAVIIDHWAFLAVRPHLDALQAAREAGHLPTPDGWIELREDLTAFLGEGEEAAR